MSEQPNTPIEDNIMSEPPSNGFGDLLPAIMAMLGSKKDDSTSSAHDSEVVRVLAEEIRAWRAEAMYWKRRTEKLESLYDQLRQGVMSDLSADTSNDTV